MSVTVNIGINGFPFGFESGMNSDFGLCFVLSAVSCRDGVWIEVAPRAGLAYRSALRET